MVNRGNATSFLRRTTGHIIGWCINCFEVFSFLCFHIMCSIFTYLYYSFQLFMCPIALKGGWFTEVKWDVTVLEPPNVGNSLNVLDKCTVCKGANLISMVWNFKGITCCNCLTRESINHCSVRSSCNFFPNAGIYFPSILSFVWFNLARSFERLIAAIFKNNKLVSHMFRHFDWVTTHRDIHPVKKKKACTTFAAQCPTSLSLLYSNCSESGLSLKWDLLSI